MVAVLSDASLYTFTGGEAPDADVLRRRYESQVAGPSDASQSWRNWIIRLADSSAAIGYVQATVTAESADVAWVIGEPWQGIGYATEAAVAMCEWLRRCGITVVSAHIHPEHVASGRVASACGLSPSDRFDADGERVWTTNGS